METKSETMKENKGRFPWKGWARFEVVDIDGIVLQFADKPTFANRWFPVEKSTYRIAGRWNQPDDASKTLIERYPSEQADPDQTPDLLARVEALEAQRGTDTALVVALTNRVASLSKEVFEMSESLEVTQSGGASFDDLRFFVGETATEPDPTAAKVEALKLLFEWREGCNYMTVDPDGDVWQWSVAPIRQGLCWTSLGAAEVAEKIGEIPPDPELSKILIKRHVEQ